MRMEGMEGMDLGQHRLQNGCLDLCPFFRHLKICSFYEYRLYTF